VCRVVGIVAKCHSESTVIIIRRRCSASPLAGLGTATGAWAVRHGLVSQDFIQSSLLIAPDASLFAAAGRPGPSVRSRRLPVAAWVAWGKHQSWRCGEGNDGEWRMRRHRVTEPKRGFQHKAGFIGRTE
jgi:hypothetical protein